jgi:hypothetical protein
VHSIVNQTQFEHQFRTFTKGLFDGFDFSNVVIIGGSVVGSLLPIPPSSSPSAEEYYTNFSPFKETNVDVYIYGLKEYDFGAKVKSIFEFLKTKVAPNSLHIAKATDVIVFYSYPHRHVQISLKYVVWRRRVRR